jgi:hypothetical protein
MRRGVAMRDYALHTDEALFLAVRANNAVGLERV